MKRIAFTPLLFLVAQFVFGQESSSTQKEIGLAFYGFDNFGLVYRTGTPTRLWRFNNSFILGNNQNQKSDDTHRTDQSFGVSLSAGREFRKSIHEKIQFRSGFDFSFSFSHQKFAQDDLTPNNNDSGYEWTTWRPGINAVVGVNYSLGDRMQIGFEILPGIGYTMGSRTDYQYFINNGEKVKSDLSGFNVNFSNSALVTFVIKL